MNSRDEAAQQQDEEEKVKRCRELYTIASWSYLFSLNDLKDLRYFLGLTKEQP